MKKSFLRFGLCAALALFSSAALSAQSAWGDVKPEITKVEETANANEVSVLYNLKTSRGDKVTVKMDGKASSSNVAGHTRKDEKHSEFILTSSGTYTFTVIADRKGAMVESAPYKFVYSLPLVKTNVSALNKGNGTVEVKWTSVPEAEGYVLSYTKDGKTEKMAQTSALNAVLTGLKAGSYSDITVTAVRGKDSKASDTMHKLIRDDAEREWFFTEYGASTGPDRNNYKLLDSNNLKVQLNSCIYDSKTGNIVTKGGKFMAYFDGISYYYTVIDAAKENFTLTATVHVDYHNPMADGQEGFGILALDALGDSGITDVVHYTNSAGIISWKYTTHDAAGNKKEIKDGLGARFVTGITPEVLAKGDTGVTTNANCEANAFSYDQSSDSIKTGDTFRITLKKDNTGYHAIYKRAIPSEDSIEEYILYDNKNEELRQQDKDHIYLGFVVARGCNATFSDVDLKITDPKTDPKAIPEPPVLVALNTVIDSPTTWTNNKYPFVFNANSNGTIHIETADGKVLVKADKVLASTKFKTNDYKKTLKVAKKGITDLLVTFTPEQGFNPNPTAKRRHAIAQWNKEGNVSFLEESYKPVTLQQTVIVNTYPGKEIWADPNGTALGKGTKESPLDIQSAINYCMPGQTVILKGGTYRPKRNLIFERGNDGTAKKRKTIIAEPGTRAIIDLRDFTSTRAGVELYGNYWTVKNIDITKAVENEKGMQIYGSYNILESVDAYLNGDTGIQIAGRASEPFDKWPSHNLIYACESFGNADPADNNADGFAAKLTCGEGNIFRNCVAHHNVDDGWDLYAKTETGPIGVVLVENCIAYGNGKRLDGSGKGDGNGFKLGGEGIAVPHKIVNSISFGNTLNGITTNSNPALIVEKCTVYGNASYNITLYGKGKLTAQFPRTFKASGVLSLNGGSADTVDERLKNSIDAGVSYPEIVSDDNYLWNGAQSVNKAGTIVKDDVFVSVDYKDWLSGYKADGKSFNRLPRENGKFNLGDLFKRTAKTPANAGADYNNINAK